MNTDRSKSLYVISWIHDTQPISPLLIESKLKEKYGFFDSRYVEQRIREQQVRGIIKIEDGSYELTTIGQLIWRAAEVLSVIFKLDGWKDNKIIS